MRPANRVGMACALAGLMTLWTGGGCSTAGSTPTPRGYTVVATYPHDSTAYTQGLLWFDGALLESTGLYGQSDVRRVEFRTGRVLDRHPLSSERFGEGLTRLGDRLYQLTWKSGVAYVYDATTLAVIDSLSYTGEGWGLTTDDSLLVMSDGTDTLRWRDPRTFAVRRSLPIRYSTMEPVPALNELEYVNGSILANLYQSDWIVRIDPTTGVVSDVLDFGQLYPVKSAAQTAEDVLNGIAVDPATGHLLLTGKRWPSLFEVRLDPRG